MTPRTIGITGTCPVEVLVATGARVLDLNNLFVGHPRRLDLLARAHDLGMAPTQCAWTRGMLAICAESLAGRSRSDANGEGALPLFPRGRDWEGVRAPSTEPGNNTDEGGGLPHLDALVVVMRGDCT